MQYNFIPLVEKLRWLVRYKHAGEFKKYFFFDIYNDNQFLRPRKWL